MEMATPNSFIVRLITITTKPLLVLFVMSFSLFVRHAFMAATRSSTKINAEIMPFFALYHSCAYSGRTKSTENVGFHCNGFKVRWIHAGMSPTEMVNGEPTRNWPHVEFICYTVYKSCFSTYFDFAISRSISIPHPQLAPRPLRNSCLKSTLDIVFVCTPHGFLVLRGLFQ